MLGIIVLFKRPMTPKFHFPHRRHVVSFNDTRLETYCSLHMAGFHCQRKQSSPRNTKIFSPKHGANFSCDLGSVAGYVFGWPSVFTMLHIVQSETCCYQIFLFVLAVNQVFFNTCLFRNLLEAGDSFANLQNRLLLFHFLHFVILIYPRPCLCKEIIYSFKFMELLFDHFWHTFKHFHQQLWKVQVFNVF